MKTKLTLLYLFFSLTFYSQSKRVIVKEIRDYKKDLVMNAKYNQKQSDIFSAMYQVVSQEYNTITKESESRGFVEGKQETEKYREYMTAEISGSQPPYRVSFSVKKETRTKKEDGTWSDWSASSVSDSYIQKVYTSLYEKLNGKIELTDELKSKIEDFNSKQEKERHKISIKDY